MAQTLQERAAGRGFPVFDYAGQSGQGALQDATAPAPAAGLDSGTWTDPNQDPGSVPAPAITPEEFQLGLTLWGLSGAINPDDTPRSHAAPFTDPAQLAVGEDGGTHGPLFTGVAERQPVTLGRFRESRVQGEGSHADNLEPLTGQIRANAGRDAVQGYGGGGPGPGGVNDPQGPVTDVQVFPGETYTPFVNAAEKPFLTPEAAQFIATAPELPPYMPTWDAPTTTVSAQQVAGTDTPAQGAELPAAAAALPAYAGSFWS
jgi:hypothetical protein